VIHTFLFHDIVRLDIETEDEECARYFQAEYRPYFGQSTSKASLPSVSLIFRRGTMANPGFDGVRHTHKILARWVYRVEVGEHQIHILAQGNRWAIPMIHHMLIHPSLRMLAAKQGVLLLHAGAVTYRTHSLVLTGTGGVGKTTTTSVLLAQNDPQWGLHADDYVFLSPEGKTFSYLTRSHLYWPLLSWVPELKRRLTLSERLRLRLLWLIRKGTRDKVKWPVRVDAARLWPGRQHRPAAWLGAVVWLHRGQGRRSSLVPLQPSVEDVDRLLAVNFFEARHYLALLRAQKHFDPRVIQQWREQERRLLSAVAASSPWYALRIPADTRDLSFLDALQRLFSEAG